MGSNATFLQKDIGMYQVSSFKVNGFERKTMAKETRDPTFSGVFL